MSNARGNYAEACKRAATEQGLDPALSALKAAGFHAVAEQTGGFVMVAAVYAVDGGWIGVTEDPETSGFLVCGYLEASGEGFTIARSAPVDHLADYVRGFVGAHGGEYPACSPLPGHRAACALSSQTIFPDGFCPVHHPLTDR